MLRNAVLFDLDGTLWNAPIDWRSIRHAMGLCYTGEPILQQIMGLTDGRREAALEILREHESRGVSEGSIIDGAAALCCALRAAGVLCGLVSNNTRNNVEAVVRLTGLQFDAVFSRDDVPAKPAPDGFIAAMRQLDVEADNAAMVGDTHLDAIAAHAAGIRRIILVSPPAWSADLIPETVPWQRAENLEAVRQCLLSDRCRAGSVPAAADPNEETNDHVHCA